MQLPPSLPLRLDPFFRFFILFLPSFLKRIIFCPVRCFGVFLYQRFFPDYHHRHADIKKSKQFAALPLFSFLFHLFSLSLTHTHTHTQVHTHTLTLSHPCALSHPCTLSHTLKFISSHAHPTSKARSTAPI